MIEHLIKMFDYGVNQYINVNNKNKTVCRTMFYTYY